MTPDDERVCEAKRRVARRAELRAEAAAEGMELPEDYRENLRRQFAEGQAEAAAIVKTYLRPKAPPPIPTQGLGATITRLLAEHWPNSGVNGHYLADLLRDQGYSPGSRGDA